MIFRWFLVPLSLVLLLMPLFAATTGKTCVGKVCFDNEAKLENKTIPIAGAGLLRYWGFKVYTAAFYSEDPSAPLDSILSDQSKQLVLHYHRKISASDIAKSTEQFIRKDPDADYDALKDRLDQVYAAYRNVKDGDEYRIVYEPELGTSIHFNGKEEIVVGGADFAAAFFGIWISDTSVNRDLQRELLGKK